MGDGVEGSLENSLPKSKKKVPKIKKSTNQNVEFFEMRGEGSECKC